MSYKHQSQRELGDYGLFVIVYFVSWVTDTVDNEGSRARTIKITEINKTKQTENQLTKQTNQNQNNNKTETKLLCPKGGY